MTTTAQTSVRVALAVLAASAAGALAAGATDAAPASHVSGPRVVESRLATHSRSSTYDWPVAPFDRQHAVRAFLDDPRIGDKGGRAFHFGIDIAAADGTPVYAVEAGTVYIDSPVAIAVVALDRSHSFGYWHIVPVVRSHQLVQRHQLLGRIGKGWGHVHFAERRGDEYVNPLRPGGLGPYADRTAPTVDRVAVQGGAIVAVAHDTPSPAVSGAWRGEPVTPALLRWRVAGATRWHTVVDFRSVMLPASRFSEVYAPGTRQNHKGAAGRFAFYLVRGAAAHALAAGHATLELQAADTAGNRVDVRWTL